MILFLSILIGYFLGSVNPAYIFGWLYKKQDIRTFGTKNAGGTNILKNVGIIPGIITIIYDLAKGLLAIFIASKIGVNNPWYLLAGLGAFSGHVFPFYLNFRGGQGVAVLMSLFFFSSFKLFSVISFPWPEFSALVIVVLSLLYITYKGDVLGLTTIPLLWLILIKLLILNPTSWFYIAIIFAIFIYIFVINFSIIKKENIVHLKEHAKKEMLHWRTIARPLAILIPIIYIYTSKEVILWILGILGLVFILIDLARLSSRGINLLLFRFRGVFKEKERLRFSSLTYFILANFLAILLFERDIAILAITFIVFGDLAAKFFGAQYSRRFIFRERSFEGFLAYFSFCLFFGVFVGMIFGISFWFVALGALAAALIDLFSVFGIDDNFTVALLSGGTLEAIRFFI